MKRFFIETVSLALEKSTCQKLPFLPEGLTIYVNHNGRPASLISKPLNDFNLI
jgi:hypothetical protein